MNRKETLFQAVSAILALIGGLVLYLSDRSAESVYGVPSWLSFYYPGSQVFGVLGNYLPTFLHVYAFILLTVIVYAQSHRDVLIISLVWFVIESIFEIAQIDSVAQLIASHVPSWFAGIPFLENTASYFLMGTFDVLDLLSILAGTLVAYLSILIITRSKYL